MKLIKYTFLALVITWAHYAFASDEKKATPQQQAALDSLDGYKVFKLGATPLQLTSHLEATGIDGTEVELNAFGRVDGRPEGTWAGYHVETVVCDFEKGHLREVKVFIKDEHTELMEKAWLEKYGPPTEIDFLTKIWRTKTAEIKSFHNYSELVFAFRNIPLDAEIAKDDEAKKAGEVEAKVSALNRAKDL